MPAPPDVTSAATTEGVPIAPSIAPSIENARVPLERSLIDRRVLMLSGFAILLAAATGVIAQLLMHVIWFVTNVAFHGKVSSAFSTPADNRLGWLVVIVPAIGGLIVGVMARYGSKAIRGHGIPEAMEQVLLNESRIPFRIVFLKPLSAAISIGTGGPFGAEGPIIATGGAAGSLVGQLVRMSATERKTLLAAGAAAGMAATFGSPVSAVILAIELLLFEFRPRIDHPRLARRGDRCRCAHRGTSAASKRQAGSAAKRNRLGGIQASVSVRASARASRLEAFMKKLVRKHPLAIRWFHWINFPLLAVMIWSGMLIYWAYPIYRIGAGSHTIVKMNVSQPVWKSLHVNNRLAEGMGFHFLFMWLFAINGVLYVLYTMVSGEWRELVPTKRSFKEAWFVFLHDLHLRKEAPPVRKFNGAQQIAYTLVILMGLGSLLTGLAIYKPVQFSWLTAIFGGYPMSRFFHFWLTVGYVFFFVVHVGQVIKTGWNNFRAMIIGYEVQTGDGEQA